MPWSLVDWFSLTEYPLLKCQQSYIVHCTPYTLVPRIVFRASSISERASESGSLTSASEDDFCGHSLFITMGSDKCVRLMQTSTQNCTPSKAIDTSRIIYPAVSNFLTDPGSRDQGVSCNWYPFLARHIGLYIFICYHAALPLH